MAITPNSFEWYAILGLTIFTIILKGILILLLGKKVKDKTKETGKIQYDFLFGVFLFMISLFLARIIFVLFDFVYTKFDVSTYPESPNIWIWKIATAVSAIGPIILLFILDKKILNFKLKGIPAWLMIVGIIVVFIYPVSNSTEFEQMSFTLMFFAAGGLLILFIFGYLIVKSTGEIRKMATILLVGLSMWTIAGLMQNEFFLSIAKGMYGDNIQVVVYFISVLFKSIGLTMFEFGATKFKT